MDNLDLRSNGVKFNFENGHNCGDEIDLGIGLYTVVTTILLSRMEPV